MQQPDQDLSTHFYIIACLILGIYIIIRREKKRLRLTNIQAMFQKRSNQLLKDLMSSRNFEEFKAVQREIEMFQSEFRGVIPYQLYNHKVSILRLHSLRVSQFYKKKPSIS